LTDSSTTSTPRIGLALGSGSARGMAHIGVIQALQERGIVPDIICGTSIGSLVAAVHMANGLDTLEKWVTRLQTRDVLRYLGIKLLPGGGFADGHRLINYLRDTFGDFRIEDAPKSLCLVATDLAHGREVWLREGLIWDAVRASLAIPGILTPHQLNGRWLVDGALLNPVPVSVCRAMGADIIIAVNLNGDVLDRHLTPILPDAKTSPPSETATSLLDRVSTRLQTRSDSLMRAWFGSQNNAPSLADVLATSINIMQDHITRSRLAGEPADVVITPRLNRIGLFEFGRATEAIAEGRAAVRRARINIDYALGMEDSDS
jgi:NTE family protein